MNARNAQIIQQRAEGHTFQSIALEHGLSPARVCKIVQDHAKDVRIAELESALMCINDLNEEALGLIYRHGASPVAPLEQAQGILDKLKL